MQLIEEPPEHPDGPVAPWMPSPPPASPPASQGAEGPQVFDTDEELERIDTIVRDRLGDQCPLIEVDLTARRIFLKEMINFWAGTADIKPACFQIVEQLQVACRMIHTVVAEEGMPPLHL